MPTITQTGTIQSIAPLANGKFRITLVENSYPITTIGVGSGNVVANTISSSPVW